MSPPIKKGSFGKNVPSGQERVLAQTHLQSSIRLSFLESEWLTKWPLHPSGATFELNDCKPGVEYIQENVDFKG